MPVLRVAIVGAGPQGTAVLIRLLARAARLPDGHRLHVHVVEPAEPGAGLVWGTGQSPHLLMNSPIGAADFFASTAPESPPGATVPSLAGWLARSPDITHGGSCPGFAPRATVGRYLSDVFGALRPTTGPVQVSVHRQAATQLLDSDRGQQLRLADGAVLEVDAVVLAQGHLPVAPTTAERTLLTIAARDGWTYQPPAPAGAVDVDALRPGAAVALRGFGLAAVDLIALLTHGRGGRFATGADGGLRYDPSGREPVLHVGSRSGLPHRGKPPAGVTPDPLEPPDFLDPRTLATSDGPLDFARDVWPLIRSDVAVAYFRQIRALGAWDPNIAVDHLVEILRRDGPDSDAARRLTVRAVRDGRYRDPDGWWRGRRPGDPPGDVRRALRADLDQVLAPDHCARLAARSAFVRAAGTVAALELNGWLSSRSLVDHVHRWFWPMSSALTSGPPRGRVQQLLALIDGGVVRPLGGGMTIARGRAGPTVTGTLTAQPVRVSAVVEARLPRPDLARTDDPLVAGLLRTRQAVEVILGSGEKLVSTGALAIDPRYRLLTADGRAHPRRWALGPSVRVITDPASRRSLDVPTPMDAADAVGADILRTLTGAPGDRAPDVFAPGPTVDHSIV